MKNTILTYFLLLLSIATTQGQETVIKEFKGNGNNITYNVSCRGDKYDYTNISSINVKGVGKLEGKTKLAQVDISITHDNIKGLHVVLIPPRIPGEREYTGSIDLFSQEGKEGNKPERKTSKMSFQYNYGNQNNISFIEGDASPPFNGTYFSRQDFQNDSGRLADGEWQIRVCDYGASYVGKPVDPEKPDGSKHKHGKGRIGDITLHFEVLDFDKMDLQGALNHVKYRQLIKDTGDEAKRKDGIIGCHDAVEWAKIKKMKFEDYSHPVGKRYDDEEEIFDDPDMPEVIIITDDPHKIVPGVRQIGYGIPSLHIPHKAVAPDKKDRFRQTNGDLHIFGEPKTIYDPKVWTDSKLLKALKEAIEDSVKNNNGVLKENWNGVTKGNYPITGFFRGGKIKTFYFSL